MVFVGWLLFHQPCLTNPKFPAQLALTFESTGAESTGVETNEIRFFSRHVMIGNAHLHRLYMVIGP